jgi:hypothetical protein
VSDPGNPVEVAQVETGQDTKGVAVIDAYAYVGDVDRGVSIVDVSEPRDPRVTRVLENTEGAWGVMVAGERLYVGSFDGMLTYDLADRGNPRFLSRIFAGEETLGGCVDGGCHAIRCALGYIYTVRRGLYILQVQED